ncbi:MAG: ABC transporter permease [Planctomycetes bacterium]|nr:ABC transporter permease [Planctomycetota bacterium]
MTLVTIVRKNLRQRALASTLTAASIALGVAVVVGILTLKEQSQAGFSQSAFGYELVVGSRGSALQLVLNTVYHMDQSQGNIPYSLYRELAGDRRVKMVIPVAVGDSYQGFRIVGTSDRFITEFEILPDQRFELAEGRAFSFSEEMLEHVMTSSSHHDHDHEGMKFEAVIGSTVAARTSLKVGSTFEAAHGVEEGPGTEKHEEVWTVTGVLKPTGTPNDRAIFINLESFFSIKGHVRPGEEGRGPEISAAILKTRGGLAARDLAYDLNRRPDAMAVVPAQVVAELFEMIGKVDKLLLAVSVLVILVAGVSILVSIYNSMSERRRPIAIMRALGARRTTILAIIVLEATALCLIGGGVGVIGGHAMAELSGGILKAQAGIPITGWAFHPLEFVIIGGLLVLGVLIGLLPALKAYRTDIAEGLSPTV